MTTYKFLASDSASAMEEVVKKLGPVFYMGMARHRHNTADG